MTQNFAFYVVYILYTMQTLRIIRIFPRLFHLKVIMLLTILTVILNYLNPCMNEVSVQGDFCRKIILNEAVIYTGVYSFCRLSNFIKKTC